MSWFKSFLGHSGKRRQAETLYEALVHLVRQPDWYARGQVPDTVDGRFDILALALSLAFARLKKEGEAGVPLSKGLLELFVDDMDNSLREMGVGDLSVGKQVQKMVSALNGRQQAYEGALASQDPAELPAALVRNAYRGETPGPKALDWLVERTRALDARFAALSLDNLKRGQLGEERP
ncbi:ubiquinol-cytochrome C chaperone family protein [Pedomonas mirosovicensis]|uniref:ubiquinol-cytochrome C chaperone family protein n=1 Tax=Pedomonas mirosovicensis TaxID=2908641 RepID=UPI00216982F4|nr:ubiquinol-cytochrome C chaperone family protein [Pedomonas mirosovicensis]MCH8685002.1 ubiquinol-cytochrome C chaperone [Pedomonas mirosovicensis]